MAALTETITWQLAVLPSAPQYWCATPGEKRASFGRLVSSTTQPSGSISALIRRASRRRTGASSQGESVMNCCSACSSPSGSLAAIGWIDLRRPSSRRPRTYCSPFARWSHRASERYICSANSISSARCASGQSP